MNKSNKAILIVFMTGIMYSFIIYNSGTDITELSTGVGFVVCGVVLSGIAYVIYNIISD